MGAPRGPAGELRVGDMNPKAEVKASKFLSLVLRHKPAKIGITLDDAGWTDVSVLLAALAKQGRKLSREDLDYVVANNAKKRFAFSEDGTRIRASQGHSVEVDLAYEPATPPDVLYHGTVPKFLGSIGTQGLLKGKRHHVHLSADRETATTVGGRRGTPVVLLVDVVKMVAAGHQFYKSANGVWLTEHVPPEFLDL